jgi:uncharacterized OB-fold protein
VSGIPIARCNRCGWHGFPNPIWCAACGCYELTEVAASHGVVEDRTTVRRAAGRPAGDPLQLATVRLDEGPRVIARSSDAEVGAPVRLEMERGAVIAIGM